MDATIIEAPPSTKNEAKARDPEMKQTKKAPNWHFGMKAHVGTDLNGLVHTLVTTDAAASGFKQMPKLLHGAERVLYGGSGVLERVAPERGHAAQRALLGEPPTEPGSAIEHAPASVEPTSLGHPRPG